MFYIFRCIFFWITYEIPPRQLVSLEHFFIMWVAILYSVFSSENSLEANSFFFYKSNVVYTLICIDTLKGLFYCLVCLSSITRLLYIPVTVIFSCFYFLMNYLKMQWLKTTLNHFPSDYSFWPQPSGKQSSFRCTGHLTGDQGSAQTLWMAVEPAWQFVLSSWTLWALLSHFQNRGLSNMML